ncbi:hypothetical protein C1646_668706 [Rhizophagus diaphanus]|nr:hypothetical protein C1646_668706 [Rhizophagus diaphanus] [Rhizophagus sp. MUCL 43196]
MNCIFGSPSNKKCIPSRYAATIRAQTRRHEKNRRFGNMVKELLKYFIRLMGSNQKNILFTETEFRSDGTEEASHIFSQWKSELAIGSGNCLPGIVAKDDITHPFNSIFISHHALQKKRFTNDWFFQCLPDAKEMNIPFQPPDRSSFPTLKGQFQLWSILPEFSNHIFSRSKHYIYFLSQLASDEGMYLLSWTDLRRLRLVNLKGKIVATLLKDKKLIGFEEQSAAGMPRRNSDYPDAFAAHLFSGLIAGNFSVSPFTITESFFPQRCQSIWLITFLLNQITNEINHKTRQSGGPTKERARSVQVRIFGSNGKFYRKEGKNLLPEVEEGVGLKLEKTARTEDAIVRALNVSGP